MRVCLLVAVGHGTCWLVVAVGVIPGRSTFLCMCIFVRVFVCVCMLGRVSQDFPKKDICLPERSSQQEEGYIFIHESFWKMGENGWKMEEELENKGVGKWRRGWKIGGKWRSRRVERREALMVVGGETCGKSKGCFLPCS